MVIATAHIAKSKAYVQPRHIHLRSATKLVRLAYVRVEVVAFADAIGRSRPNAAIPPRPPNGSSCSGNGHPGSVLQCDAARRAVVTEQQTSGRLVKVFRGASRSQRHW